MNRPKPDAESIFLAALERPSLDDRAAFLTSACGRDDALRRRVEALLRAHDLAGSFLGGPAAGADLRAGDLTDPGDGRPAVANTLTILSLSHGAMPHVLLRDPLEAPVTPIPAPPTAGEARTRPPSARYHFFGEIARGGMGSVIKGHDTELNRDLAIKILLDQHRDNPELVRRFVEEAQIGGQLQHPGIVPIHELGVLPDHRPFFAMKLVKGRTLAELLGERPDPAEDRPRLLSIFEAVCQTVAYAHARGVIHRDLKPSNVMVGSFGEVQVMDWGLAEALPRGGVADEPAGPTPEPEAGMSAVRTARSGSDVDASRAGSVLGTPGYMSPEQARGELERVDERADVFGLGAILCEVLTGSPAFVGRGSAEALRTAGRGELGDAFARLDACGAEAELIALAKDCLAAEREDRPRRAGAVAERMTAYLAGVQERLRRSELERVEANARAEEDRKRRRLAVALAAAVVALVGTVGGGSAWLERQASARALAASQGINDALVRAATLQGRAVGPPGDLAAWGEALAQVGRAEDLIAQLDPGPTLRDRVRRARAELERGRDAARAADDRLRRDRTLLERLEEIRIGFDEHLDWKRADAEYVATFRAAGIDPDATAPERAAAAIAERGQPMAVQLASFLDDWAHVRRMAGTGAGAVGRLVEAARAADPEPWRDALRAGLDTSGAGALEALRKLAADEGALASQPVESLWLLAMRLKNAGDHEASARVLRCAWRLRPDDFWVNLELAESGLPTIRVTGTEPPRSEEAMRHLTAALALRPRSPAVHNNLGNALASRGKTAEAIAEFREAIRLRPDNAWVYHNLGNVLTRQGKTAEAIAEFRKAVRLQPDFFETRFQLADLHHRRGEMAEAVAEFREAIRLRPAFPNSYAGLGYALDALGRRDEAVAAWRTAVRLQPDQARIHFWIGAAMEQAGRPADALESFRQARRYAGPEQGFIAEIEQKIAAIEKADQLPAVLRGEAVPADAAERLTFAGLAHSAKRYASAARLYAETFRDDPKLAEDLASGNLYNAACSAALAAAGRGEDRPPLDPAARAHWRRQALDWLKADLERSGRIAGRARPDLRDRLVYWKQDPDLAGVRDPAALAALTAAERDDWRAFWAEVDRLLERVGSG